MATAATATTPPAIQSGPKRKIELPPPAWGSPAHNALQKAEKEWVVHLRQHASADAANKKAGKQSKYVDAIDIVVRYTLPPTWDTADGGAPGVGQKTGEELWKLPEDDKTLINVLKASYTPFFQRTGEFQKASPAFKVPPPKSPAKSPSDLEKGQIPAENEKNGGEVQPRTGYLPPFIFNFFKRIMWVFLWFFPHSLRTRIYAWWSPILGKPPTGPTGRR